MIEELVAAIEKKDTQTVKELLTAGVDVNAETDEGDLPLMEAARLGYVEIVRLLLEYGADANQETDSSMYTPLMSAARLGQTEIAKILIDAGANVNAEDDWEESVLLRAVESNHPKMVELLLSHGADPLQRCGYVENALALAKQLGFEEIAELLGRPYDVDNCS